MQMTQSAGKVAFGERLRRARRLKAAREDRDIEQQQIAEDLGVDPATVARWLKGGSMPQTDRQLAEVAAYFGVTPAWLRYGQEPRDAELNATTGKGARAVDPALVRPSPPSKGGRRRTGTD